MSIFIWQLSPSDAIRTKNPNPWKNGAELSAGVGDGGRVGVRVLEGVGVVVGDGVFVGVSVFVWVGVLEGVTVIDGEDVGDDV